MAQWISSETKAEILTISEEMVKKHLINGEGIVTAIEQAAKLADMGLQPRELVLVFNHMHDEIDRLRALLDLRKLEGFPLPYDSEDKP